MPILQNGHQARVNFLLFRESATKSSWPKSRFSDSDEIVAPIHGWTEHIDAAFQQIFGLQEVVTVEVRTVVAYSNDMFEALFKNSLDGMGEPFGKRIAFLKTLINHHSGNATRANGLFGFPAQA